MSEQSTYEEFERVLHTEQFASIHELAERMGLRALDEGRQAPVIATTGEGASVHPLPTRR